MRIPLPIDRDAPALSFVLAWHAWACGSFLLSFVHAAWIGGGDGESHFQMARYYSEHIFPHPFGWSQGWNAGMPWPLGYPPLFHYVLALLARAYPGDFLDVFQLFAACLFFALPAFAYLTARRARLDVVASTFAGIGASHFLCHPNVDGGLTATATFGTGLYPQLFAGALFLSWVAAFFARGRVAFLLTTTLLAGVILTNVHVALPALVCHAAFGLVALLYKETRDWGLRYIASPVLSVGLGAFWLVPLVSVSEYFPYVTMPAGSGAILQVPVLAFVLLVLVVVDFIFAVRERRIVEIQLAAALVLLTIVTLLPIQLWFPSLPLQSFRYVPLVLLLAIVVASASVTPALKFVGRQRVAALAGIVVILAATQPRLGDEHRAWDLGSESLRVSEALATLGDGRSLIESWAEGTPAHFGIAARAGGERHQTLWNVFRESTLGASFTAPLRNSFSPNREYFAVHCRLCTIASNFRFYYSPLAVRLERAARWYGVRYFALRSEAAIAPFLGSSEVSLLQSVGQWALFRTKAATPLVESLDTDPVVVFARLDANRGMRAAANDYDWLRLSEAWFAQDHAKFVLAHAREQRLDRTADLRSFRFALLLDYQMDDGAEAERRLIEAATQGTTIVMVTPSEPLAWFDDLRQRTRSDPHFLFLDRRPTAESDLQNILETLASRVQSRPRNIVTDIVFRDELVSFRSTPATATYPDDEIRAYYVKMSYFPWWHDVGGGSTYMASPTNTLVLTRRDDVALRFELPHSFTLGCAISLVSAAILLVVTIRTKVV